MLAKPEIFPQWNDPIEFLQSIFLPWVNIHQTDSEKWIPLGIIVSTLAFYGFLKLGKKLKVSIGEALIITYAPNRIRVDTSSHNTNRLVLSEVWSPGWKAYLNGKEEVRVQEKPNTLRLVNIKADTRFVILNISRIVSR